MLEELDSELNLAELNEALDSLASGEAHWRDNIPPEVLKCCKGILAIELRKIFCQCWREGGVLHNMKDANIVTLHKNKGDRGNCNDCWGIPVLSVVEKMLARVVQKRLQVPAEYFQNHSVGSGQTGPLLSWSSPLDSCTRNAGNSDSHSSLPS